MTNTTAIITFQKAFSYAENGQMEKAKSIELTAPGLTLFAVHNRMSAYANEVGVKALRMIGVDGFAVLENIGSVEEAQAADAANKTEANDNDTEHLTNYKIALADEYPAFAEYLLDTIKNDARLARVAGTDTPLTDGLVESIVAENGIPALERVFDGFVGFYQGN